MNCSKCGTEFEEGNGFCVKCGEPKPRVATNAEVQAGTAAVISHDVVVDNQYAYRQGEQVVVKAITPNQQRPEYKYVVFSLALGSYFQLSDQDISAETPIVTRSFDQHASQGHTESKGSVEAVVAKNRYVTPLVIILLLLSGLILASTWMPWHNVPLTSEQRDVNALTEYYLDLKGIQSGKSVYEPDKPSGWKYMFPNEGYATGSERYNSGYTNGIFFNSQEGITVLTGAWTILFGLTLIVFCILYLAKKNTKWMLVVASIGLASFVLSLLAKTPWWDSNLSRYGMGFTTAYGGWVFVVASLAVFLLSTTLAVNLVHSGGFGGSRKVKCAYCFGVVPVDATMCKHCGSNIR